MCKKAARVRKHITFDKLWKNMSRQYFKKTHKDFTIYMSRQYF